MKLSKFLLISALSALALSIFTLPVVAKSSVKSHLIHLQHSQPSQTAISLRSSLYDQLNGYDRVHKINTPSNMLNNNFTGTLILNIQPMFQEIDKNNINNGSHIHTFFETTMIFNDKLQQFLSLFEDAKIDNEDNEDKILDKGCESKF